MNFQHFCFSATPALPYAPYIKRTMHVSYFRYARHIFVITSYIVASTFRHCNVMAPSLCPQKSSIPRLLNSRSFHGTAILPIGSLLNPPSDDFYRKNRAQVDPRPARGAPQTLHQTISSPTKLPRSPPRGALSCILPILDTLHCL